MQLLSAIRKKAVGFHLLEILKLLVIRHGVQHLPAERNIRLCDFAKVSKTADNFNST